MYCRGLTTLVCLTLLVTTAYSNLDPNDAKVCNGASVDDSMSGTERDHYLQLKSMYKGCNYVLGNIEIYGMPNLSNVSLDFFNNITEVSGYIRVHGSLPIGITKLPFINLRIIRGESLTRYSDSSEREFSLFIYQIANLRSLGLVNLREISRGNVYIGYNNQNCYGDKIDWRDVFGERNEQRANVSISTRANCPAKSARCHSSCGDSSNAESYCWGPGKDDCQRLNKVNCANQCDYRCYGPESNECCHRTCLAGCYGPRDTDCWGCRDFYNNGTCTHQCPPPTIYNGTTYKFDVNPEAKVSFGKLCLDKCPDGHYEYNYGCVLYKCPAGYINNDDDKCVPCDGPCPKVCDWTSLKEIEPLKYWPTSEFLRSYRNESCTIISGDVQLISGAFERLQPGDIQHNVDAITLDDLKVFETVEEISGVLIFEPESKIPGLKNLSFFGNLRKVGGSGASSEVLAIVCGTCESLAMPNLRQVSNHEVYFQAPNLCYDVDQTLPGMLPTTPAEYFNFYQLGDPSKCEAAGMVCDEQCNGACVGSGPSLCVSQCSESLTNCTNKCKNFELEGQCVAVCDRNGFYANGTQCHRCHEQCAGACNGSLDTDCETCKNFKNGNRCVQECPLPTYPDGDKRCQPCNAFCTIEKPFGCSGPMATIGTTGCNACKLLMLSDSGDTLEGCINATKKCPSNYLTLNQWSELPEPIKNTVPSEGFSEACLKCNPECAECKGRTHVCNKCSNKAYEWKKQNSRSFEFYCKLKQDCDLNNHYVNESSNQCVECHSACNRCTGPTDLDCETCKGLRVLLNNTDGFQCVSDCPPHLNYTWYDETTQFRECHAYPPPKTGGSTNSQSDVDGAAIGGSVAAVVIIIAVALIIVTYICRQRTRHMAMAKEYEMRITGTGSVVPLEPTDANPDLSQLRLIKESELRKTVIIGSGAFGTVYKGYLIPEHENVKVQVAIKVLTEGTAAQTTELLDEARVMASVDHPCCIKIVAVCMTAQMMLVTPLMSSGCLLSYVKSHAGQLGSKVLINWCAQIAKGMEHLQRCGIVHRDLAARNVLVQNETQVKITDFGLAKLLDVGEDYYKADSGKVPVKWMALESIQHRIFNHQTDVWSYGVTIWELLTFGQKPYDGVKARDIAILLERGERLNQPTISTIDVYMIMIKCWMLDANTRPTFEDLAKEFTKMARDPGRYLVIDGDQLKRNPTLKMNSNWNFDDFPEDDMYPEKQLVGADEYLSPSIASNYPHYENEDAIPPPFEKNSQSGSVDYPHSPLRYTSSPTLRQPADSDKLFVDTESTENYLQPVPSRGATMERPEVDDDGYLQPQSTTSVYIDVLSDDPTNVSPMKKKQLRDAHEEDQALQPLLGADNSIYLSSKDDDNVQAHPTHMTGSNPMLSARPLPNGTNPIYMSNNNGSLVNKQPSGPEYVNQDATSMV